jgi:hypothetical protein
MKLKKFSRKYWIILFVVIFVLLFSFILYMGWPIGQECGYWSFFQSYEKNCECIGIKTGHCPPGAVCDGGSFGCIGICRNCVCRRMNSLTYDWEEVSCELLQYPQITEKPCDAINPCPEGLECFSFPSIGLRCAQPNPCTYFKCPEGTQCTIAESFPGQVKCI